MSEFFGRTRRHTPRPLPSRRAPPAWLLLLPVVPVGIGLWASLPLRPVPDAPRISFGRHAAAPAAVTPAQAPGPHEAMIRLGMVAEPLGQVAPLPSDWQPKSVPPAPEAAPAPAPAIAAAATPATAAQAPTVTATAEAKPTPASRPADLQSTPDRTRVANASIQRRARMSVAAAPVTPATDTRNFLQRLFGAAPTTATGEPQRQALAYAAPQTDDADPARSRRLGRVTPSAGELTAVYDISARAVILPGGEKLEAHSGLGDRLDDPRYVHERMKGATPPHVYDLTLREALFHGVRAIRLNPVGGSGAIHGRAGLLAHTYMLGPNGDSNGCISIRNYERFLQAYLKGEIRRLIVVASMN